MSIFKFLHTLQNSCMVNRYHLAASLSTRVLTCEANDSIGKTNSSGTYMRVRD